MRELAVVEVSGTDQYGQLQVDRVETAEHVNAARAEFIERMGDDGLHLTSVKARKVATVWREDEE